MKKGAIIGLMIMLCMGFASAVCTLNVSMINQDPYPAIPGESVKVIFQINGVSNPQCGIVKFSVKEGFPFTIDPESENPISINSGTYIRTYSSFYLAPYKIRVDEDALNGDTPIETTYTGASGVEFLNEFNIYVENTRADFEIHVKDYNTNTEALTLEILNIEDVDVQAVAVKIPKQGNITVKGANEVIVGDLDSNEYTTAEFKAVPKDGEINLTIVYTDSADIRREINKTITYDSSYFAGLYGNNSLSYVLYSLIAVAVVGFFVWRWLRKRRMKNRLHHPH